MPIQVDLANSSGFLQTGAISTTEGNVSSPAGPLRLAAGSIALDNTNPTPVTTGLAQIIAGGAGLTDTAAPGVGTSVINATYSAIGGTLNLYAWKVTSSANPTLIASTGTETVNWWAFGY